MILKDRLFSKYGDNLSLSIINNELKKFNLSFTPKMYDPETFLPMSGILYEYGTPGKRVVVKLRGNIFLNYGREDTVEDYYNILDQVDKILSEEAKKHTELNLLLKNEIIIYRYEQKNK